MSASCDLLVIGAGPAGLAAASTAAKRGVDVTLMDEQVAPGGQIHRAMESRAFKAESVSRADDERGVALVAEFRASGSRYQPGTQAWQMQADGKVYVTDGARAGYHCPARHYRGGCDRTCRADSGLDTAGRDDGGRRTNSFKNNYLQTAC